MISKKRVPVPRFETEAALAEWALAQLDPWFVVEREVRGRQCTGRWLRLDAVLRPRDPSGWKDDNPAFGVEFKLTGRSFDTSDFTRWAAQAVDYTHVDWNGYGRLCIFTCPSFIQPFLHAGERWDTAAFLMARTLGQFGVGELWPMEGEGWALVLHEMHVLWSQRRGVSEAARWSLYRRIGGRR